MVPRAGELLYSVIARVKVRRGDEHVRPLLRALFDNPSRIASPDIPAGARELARLADVFGSATPEQLLRRHTLLPLFTASLPAERAREIERALLANRRGGVFAHLGIPASSVRAPEFLRLCPDCADDEQREFGEITWRRVHQCPGVYVCPQHGQPLVDTTVPVRSTRRHTFVHASVALLRDGRPAISGDLHAVAVMSVAKAIDEVLRGEIADLRTDAIEWLSHARGRSCGEKASAVGHRAISVFGTNYLERIGLLGGFEKPTGWLRSAIYNPRRLSHPLRFILFRVLARSEPAPASPPAGRERWACPNLATRHASRRTVRRIGPIRASEGGGARYGCTACGFIFSSETEASSHRLVVRRVIRWGAFIETEVQRLREQGLGLRAAARELGMDPASVRRLWKRDGTDPSRALPEGDRSAMRSRWIGCLETSGLSPSSARRKAPAVYAWLHRKDREWLLAANARCPRARCGPSSRVDWPARDQALAESMRLAAAQLLAQAPPARITASALAKRTGCYTRLRAWIAKMPETRAMLAETIESVEEFQARRLRSIAKSMSDLASAPPAWALLRAAGIRSSHVTPRLATVLQETCGGF